MAATITAGERRSNAIDTSDLSTDVSEKEQRTGRVGGSGMGSPRARARSAAAMYRSKMERASFVCATRSCNCTADASSCVSRPRSNRNAARR